jgi:hypothetical protein
MASSLPHGGFLKKDELFLTNKIIKPESDASLNTSSLRCPDSESGSPKKSYQNWILFVTEKRKS